MSKSNKYVFSLFGINLEKIDNKYKLEHSTDNCPDNTTKIISLVEKRIDDPESFVFMDESKRTRKCSLTFPKFSSQSNCYWDRNPIPKDIIPIGCPINFVPCKAVKSYFSEISKDRYIITEMITEQRKKQLENKHDKRITLEEESYYETDGIFCSFNCILAYVNENKSNPLYNYSKILTIKLYNDIHNNKINKIIPAPHWKELVEYGGNMTISQFRNSFANSEHTNYGILNCKSIAHLFEEQLKL